MSADMEPAADEQTSYDLRLSGPGVSVERAIPEEQALRIIALVMGGDAATGDAEAGGLGRARGPGTRAAAAGKLTVGEFLEEVEAKRNPDKITAIGAFISDHLGRSSFTRDEVKGQFQHGGETAPANLARDFATAVSNKWIAQVHDSPGEYFVTNTGRKAIDEHFSREVRKSRRTAPRRRPKKRAPKE